MSIHNSVMVVGVDAERVQKDLTIFERHRISSCQLDERPPGRRKSLRPQRIPQPAAAFSLPITGPKCSLKEVVPAAPLVGTSSAVRHTPSVVNERVEWCPRSEDTMYSDDYTMEVDNNGLRSPYRSSVESDRDRDGISEPCSDCGEKFPSSSSRQDRAPNHASSRSHVCSFPFCQKVFTSKYKLLRHELIHSQEKRHNCPLCQKKFHRKDHLSNHLKVHERSKVQLECKLCGCVFAKKWTFEKHTALHRRDVLFNYAGLADNNVSDHADEDDAPGDRDGDSPGPAVLQPHDQSELRVKNPAQSRSRDRVSVLSKMRPASQRPSHPCEVCGKVFSASKDLRRHLHTHLGIKPNLCPYCPKKFTRKDHVRRHVMTVHADYNAAAMERGDQG